MQKDYDAIAQKMRQEELSASMFVGVKAQPDTEATLQKIADRTGVPVDVVRNRRPELEIQEKLDNFDYKKVINDSPQLAAWLSDPANAALAHDDWENMSLLEQTLTRGADLPRALVGGAVRDTIGSTLTGTAGLIEAGARGLDAPFRAAFDASPFETLVTAGGANLNPIQSMKHTGRLIKEAGDWIAPPKERQNFATDVAGGVGQLGGQIAMYLMTGGMATTAMMYAQGADVMQSKIAKDVADQSLKDTAVIAGGAITAITERYGLDKILNRVPPEIKNRTLRFIADKVAAGGIEAAQEATEGLLHDLTRKVLVNEDAAIWEGVGNEASVAAVSAAIVRTALGVRGYRQSVAQEQLLKDLTTQVDQSKLKQRYPEKLQQYIESITKDGPLENIFVPAEQFNTYFQTAQIDPAVMASALGVQNFHEALATGGDVVIPTSAFMAQLSGTDHLQGLWEDLRLTQDAMTPRERKIAEMNRVPMEQEFAEAMAGEGDTTSADFQKAYDAIFGELKGRFDDNMAHQYATAHASAFSTLARRNNIPIDEFIAANTPRVVNGAMQDLRAVGDDVDIDLDPILDRLRAGDLPSEALAFGNSLYEFIRDAGGLEAVGEVRDLDESISRLPGQRKLAQEAGLALDAALEAAAEAGYFPGRDLSELTPADLLDALAEDIGGNRIYSAQNENDKSAHELRMLREMENWLSENNIDLASMTNAEIRAKLAEVEQGGAEYEQSNEVTRDMVRDLADSITAKHEGMKLDLMGGVNGKPLVVSRIVAQERSAGAGTSAMRDIVAFADRYGLKVALTPSKDFGGSVPRLKEFYGRFGFVENKGRNKDYEISESMLREPKAQTLYQSAPQTDSAAFKKWFGDSVVTEDGKAGGKPLVVYHGTGKDFSEFQEGKRQTQYGGGLYFGKDQKVASSFASPLRGPAPNVMPVYLSLQNPFIETGDYTKTPKVPKLKEQGYDGIIALDGQIVAFYPEQIKSAIGNSGTFDPANPSILYQMAGESAATADLPLLVQAQARIEAGEDAELVRQATGWHQGVDGKWRFEIDDSGARFRGWDYETDTEEVTSSDTDQWSDWIEESRARDKGVLLTQAFDHPALFEAYPQLKTLRIKIDDSVESGGGAFEAGSSGAVGGVIRMRDPFEYPAEGDGSAQSVLLHELQHAIQVIEGFAEGGNLGTLAQVRDAVNAQWSMWASAYGYRRAAVRNGITAKQAADREAEFMGEAPNARAVELAADLEIPIEVLEENANKLEAQLSALRKIGPSEGYRRLAGEVEARNTQARMGLTAEQRRMTSPNSTADVAADDQIIAFGTGVMQSAPRLTKRGMIQIGAGKQRFKISMFADADASTFIHESGHMYLEIMRDLAERPDAPQQTKDDWQAIRKWMGLKDGEPIGVEQHEMFARANEAYLMEGNAPNPELRGVFQRFKAWLVRIYRDVSRLNVPIDNRIRGVFDRIYATDEQIAAASSELEMSTAWATAAEAGMSEAEFAAYRATVDEAVERGESELRAQLLGEYERERKRWWNYEKSIVRKKVTQEVDSEPVYMAFKALTTGQMEDGTPIKLSRSSLVAKFGEPFVVGLPKSKERIYTEDGGTDVDTAAEVLGFANGRELIDQIANMRPRKEVIEARVDAEMRATHGDTLVDGTIEEAAESAVHNNLREKMLKIELRAIRKKAAEVGRINRAVQSEQAQERAAGEQFVRDALPQTERTRTGADGQQVTYMAFDPEPMKRAAAGLIGQKQVRDLKPHSYLLAERKAAKAFAKAMADGDYMTAAEQKQRELFNHYLYREAMAKREVVDKQAKYLNKQGQEPARQRLGKAGADYLEQVDEILERYEFKTVPLNKIAKRESLMAFVNRMEAEGKAVEVPEEVLMEGRRVNWRQMTVDELGAVHDAVRNITHLASLKNKLLVKNKRKDFDQVVAELVDAANASALRSTGDADQLNDRDRDRKTSRKWLSILRKVDANLNKVEQWVEWLDGGKWGGVWSENFFALADEAQAKEYELHRMVTKSLSDLREQMPKDWVESLDKPVGFELPVPRRQGELVVSTPNASRYTMISIALNMGNEQNMQRLRDGNKLTDEHFRKIQAAMTDADWKFVQGVWDSIELLWPDMAALHKRATGLEPVKVEPQSFEVRGQTYRGGYFPIVYDQKRSEQGEKQADSDATVQAFLSSFVGRPTTNKGATKTRMEKVNAPLRLSFDEVIGSHVAKVVKDISHREAIAGMHKLLTDGRIRDVLIDKLGDARYAQMKNFVKALVVDRVDSLGAVEGIPAIMMKARTNLSIVTMGWKMRTAASQFAGFGPSKQFVSAGYLASAAATMWKFGSDGRNLAMDTMMEKSTEMRNRAETRDRDVRDALRRLSDKKSIVADVQRSAFYLTALADRQVAGATWWGAYNEQLANGKTEEAAIAYADHAVRMSQGAGGAKDLSAIQRGHEFTKLFTMFYTPFAVLYANMTDMGYHFRKDGIAYLPKAVARAAWIIMIPAILGELLTFSGPDEDEDEVWWAVRKMLLYPVSALPIIRDLSGLAESRMIELSGEGEMEYQPNYSGSPIFPAIGKAWNNLVKKPTDWMAGERELDDDMAWDAFESAGLVFGLPTAQVRITGSYLLDLLTGDVEPEGATEIIRDGLFNKRKKEE